jgi:hypothetical protein
MIVSQVQYDDLNEGYCNDTTKEFRYQCLKPNMEESCPGFTQILDSGSYGGIDDTLIENFYKSCKSSAQDGSFCQVNQSCMSPYTPELTEYDEIDIPSCAAPNNLNIPSSNLNLFKNEICRDADLSICDSIDYCILKNSDTCVLDLDSITSDESFDCNIQELPLHYGYLHPSTSFNDLTIDRNLTNMSCISSDISDGYLSSIEPAQDNTNNENQWQVGLSCDNNNGYYGVANAYCIEGNDNFIYSGCIHKDSINNLKRYDQHYLNIICNELNDAYPDMTIYKSDIDQPKCIVQIN